MRSDELTIISAPDGGYAVMDWASGLGRESLRPSVGSFRFAGSLAEALDYVRRQFEDRPRPGPVVHEPARSAS